ncbi:MAG: tetratricopeptide repeat protein [Limisphaerales bacterium]
MPANSQKSEQPCSTRRRTILFGIVLVIGIFATFSPLLKSDFISFDDSPYVVDNPQVNQGLSWARVKWAFTESHSSNWHPITWLSHMLDCQLFGLNPGWHHFTNVVIHTLTSLLLFGLLRRLTASFWRSALVAWLFALHPLHVESVAWIAERKDVLSGFFGVLTLWLYAVYVQRKGVAPAGAGKLPPTVTYVLCLITFALGLMSKPMLVTLPFVLLLLDVWPLRRVAWGKLLLEKVPFFVLTVASCVITFAVQNKGGAVRSLDNYSFLFRFENALVSYARYLGKAVWPTDLAIFYPHAEAWSKEAVFGSLALLLAVTALAIWRFRQQPCIAIGWFWFVGMLIPVIGLVQVGEQALADRYTYLPLIGLFIAVAWGTHALVKSQYHKPLLLTAAAAALFLTVVTHAQTRTWRNSETVFAHALVVTRDNYIAHNSLGLEYMNRGDLHLAKKHFAEAIRIRKNYTLPLCNLGTIHAQEGNFAEAKLLLQQAIAADPTFEQAHYNLGHLARQEGDIGNAMLHFLAVTQVNPNNADAFSNLAILCVQSGDLPNAVRYFKEVTRLRPDDAGAYFNLGLALANLGDHNAARQQLQRALQLRPDFSEAERELATLR